MYECCGCSPRLGFRMRKKKKRNERVNYLAKKKTVLSRSLGWRICVRACQHRIPIFDSQHLDTYRPSDYTFSYIFPFNLCGSSNRVKTPKREKRERKLTVSLRKGKIIKTKSRANKNTRNIFGFDVASQTLIELIDGSD